MLFMSLDGECATAKVTLVQSARHTIPSDAKMLQCRPSPPTTKMMTRIVDTKAEGCTAWRVDVEGGNQIPTKTTWRMEPHGQGTIFFVVPAQEGQGLWLVASAVTTSCRSPKTCTRMCGLLHANDPGFIPNLCQKGRDCTRGYKSCMFYHSGEDLKSLKLPPVLYDRCMIAISHYPTFQREWRTGDEEIQRVQREYGEYCHRFLRSTTPWDWRGVTTRPNDDSDAAYYAGYHDGSQAGRHIEIAGGLLKWNTPTAQDIQTYYRGFNDGLRSVIMTRPPPPAYSVTYG